MPSHKYNLLIVTGNPEEHPRYKDFFARQGYNLFYAATAPAALELLKGTTFEIVLIVFRGKPAAASPLVRLLTDIKRFDQRIEVLLTAPVFSAEFTLKALQMGAADCVSKPRDLNVLLESLNAVAEQITLRRQTGLLEHEIRERYTFQGMISKNPQMLEVFTFIRRLAKHFTTILVTGETGTGKEMVAKALHDLSPRSRNRYVACNCSAFPESLLERELFGHLKGAFTGATDSRPGIFEYANGGTVFLDEIGEMATPLQAKLLRVVDDRTIRRIGSPKETPVDVQVITATNRDLRMAVKKGLFREDLFYRINVLEIHLPPLRERKEDIPLLCHHFLSQCNKKFNKQLRGVSRKAQMALMEHTWEGNVRELQNVIESAAILTARDYLSEQETAEQLEKSSGLPKARSLYGDDVTLEEVERQHIARILKKTAGNKVKAAAILGLSRRSLYRKIAKLGIE